VANFFKKEVPLRCSKNVMKARGGGVSRSFSDDDGAVMKISIIIIIIIIIIRIQIHYYILFFFARCLLV